MSFYIPAWVIFVMLAPWLVFVFASGIYAISYCEANFWWYVARRRDLVKIIKLVLRDEDLRDDLLSRIPKCISEAEGKVSS